jgi:hypothetical protein
MVINEKRGNDATVIHEFFHVLQFAQSWPAVGTWLREAMATWAENKYGAEDTSRLNFFREFQRDTRAGLTSRDALGHEYGAYVWLIWLAQRARSDHAVFRLWSALHPARAKDITDIDQIDQKLIDPLVDRYLATLRLSWARHFKDFAVEDLNRNLSKVTPHAFSHEPFGDPVVQFENPLLSPQLVRAPSTLTVGTHRTALGAKDDRGIHHLDVLSAQYEHIDAIRDAVRAVTVTSSRMKPWGDLVVLAHTSSGWQRRDLQNGSVTFCRKARRQHVDELYLIADNHDDRHAHSGASYTVTGKGRC